MLYRWNIVCFEVLLSDQPNDMLAPIIHFILIYIVLGIGAGSRYIFFWIIGKKKSYNELVEPDNQDKWNIIVSILITFSFFHIIHKVL